MINLEKNLQKLKGKKKKETSTGLVAMAFQIRLPRTVIEGFITIFNNFFKLFKMFLDEILFYY